MVSAGAALHPTSSSAAKRMQRMRLCFMLILSFHNEIAFIVADTAVESKKKRLQQRLYLLTFDAKIENSRIRSCSEILFRGGVRDMEDLYWIQSEDGSVDNMVVVLIIFVIGLQ